MVRGDELLTNVDGAMECSRSSQWKDVPSRPYSILMQLTWGWVKTLVPSEPQNSW